MAKMAELNDRGVTDLYSYSVGASDERDRILKLLDEQDAICTDWAAALIRGDKSNA
jgi:hypothetical protein